MTEEKVFYFHEDWEKYSTKDFLIWYDMGKPDLSETNFYDLADDSYSYCGSLSQFFIESYSCTCNCERDTFEKDHYIYYVLEIENRFFSFMERDGLYSQIFPTYEDRCIQEVRPKEIIKTIWEEI